MCFDIQLNQVGCALQSFPMLIQTTHAPATYTHFCFVKNWAVGFLLFWPPASFSSQHGEDNAHLVRNIVTSKHCFCSQYIPRVLRKVPVHLRRFRLNLFVGWMTAVSGVTRVRFRNIFGQTLFSLLSFCQFMPMNPSSKSAVCGVRFTTHCQAVKRNGLLPESADCIVFLQIAGL